MLVFKRLHSVLGTCFKTAGYDFSCWAETHYRTTTCTIRRVAFFKALMMLL